MAREEQIIEASQIYAKHLQKPFVDGALWSDKHPSPAWVEKACRFLFDNYHGEKLSLRMIENFCKYMEEQQ